MQRVAVFGSTGQLGSDLVDVLRRDNCLEVIPLSHQDADCTKASEVRAVLAKFRPDVAVNCAAYVRVDDCEVHADEAFRVNAVGALNIAKGCAEVNALCVYISTDYVFDGLKETPYVESDSPNPINVYGASKLAGELLVRQASPSWLIVRVASLFGKTGARGKGGNFIETILAKAKKGEALRVVDDIRISPTYTRDAAEIVYQLLARDSTGIFHVANSGSCTWYQFAAVVLQLCGLAVPIDPVSEAEFLSRARRPKNSAIASEKLIPEGRTLMPSWQEALRAYLIEKRYFTNSTPALGAAN